MKCADSLWIVCNPNSTNTGSFELSSSSNSKTSGPKQSGLVAMDIPTMSSQQAAS